MTDARDDVEIGAVVYRIDYTGNGAYRLTVRDYHGATGVFLERSRRTFTADTRAGAYRNVVAHAKDRTRSDPDARVKYGRATDPPEGGAVER